MKRLLQIVALTVCTVLCISSAFSCGKTEGVWAQTEEQKTVNSMVATDALGRTVQEISAENPDKLVGMFYFLWIGQHKTTGVYDIQKLLDVYGNNYDNVLWKSNRDDPDVIAQSPVEEFHYWGEPLYGYYDSGDPWVMRRHIELLTASGIDFLAIDATNADYYLDVLLKLMAIIDEFIEDGWDAPKIVLYTKTRTASMIYGAYQDIYLKNLYPRTWLTVEGKPAIIGSYAESYGAEKVQDLNEEVQNFFHIIPSQWPTEDYNDEAWPWISWEYPQYIYGDAINVSVSQHVDDPFSRSVVPNCSLAQYHANWGRGYDHERGRNNPDKIMEGLNFQGQWNTAIENKEQVNVVFITGWNEWVAQKLTTHPVTGDGVVAFVDTVTMEFSRDLEMMKGGYGDNYYLQNIQNVRTYKGISNLPDAVERSTVDWTSAEWESYGRRFRDFAGDAVARNYHASAPEYFDYEETKRKPMPDYVDNSNRNDIVDTYVAHDADYLYLRVVTKGDIQVEFMDPDRNTLNVFLSTTEQAGNNWEGYEYVLNLDIVNDHTTSLHRSTGGYNWEKVCDVDCSFGQREMRIRIPRSALGLGNAALTVDIKVADNVTNPEDIMSYYIYGDAAPIGRLSYRYRGK